MPRPPPELLRGRPLSNRSSGAWGNHGEDLALRHLEAKGYALVERNHRTRHGEIDLIMRHGSTLVFVEVKLRKGLAFGDPLEAITPRKRAAVRSLAEAYLSDKDPDFDAVRFDAVGVLMDNRSPRILHVENAF